MGKPLPLPFTLQAPPTTGSARHVVIADHSGALFAATV